MLTSFDGGGGVQGTGELTDCFPTHRKTELLGFHHQSEECYSLLMQDWVHLKKTKKIISDLITSTYVFKMNRYTTYKSTSSKQYIPIAQDVISDDGCCAMIGEFCCDRMGEGCWIGELCL